MQYKSHIVDFILYKNGENGKGIESITTEFYLSTSKTEQADGEWVTEMPEWSYGLYLWTRQKIVYKDPEGTEYTEPACDSSWEAANDVQANLDENVDEIKNVITEQHTTVLNDCEKIILQALESYVETSNYESFKETVETQLQLLAGEITMKFTTTTEEIQNVDGDMQEKWNQLYKFIKFTSDTALVIGSGDSAITLEIDNETGIVFKKNGVKFGWWDGVDFHTGNIVVNLNERAQFGDFAYIPRSDGSLSFLKVGG